MRPGMMWAHRDLIQQVIAWKVRMVLQSADVRRLQNPDFYCTPRVCLIIQLPENVVAHLVPYKEPLLAESFSGILLSHGTQRSSQIWYPVTQSS